MSENGQAEPASADVLPRQRRSHHMPALILLWVVILIACYFIWPSEGNFINLTPPVTQPLPVTR